MAGLVTVVLTSLFLGLGCFGIGMLPLSFVYPKSYTAKLSTLGTGLLLGAALGVIIPEGIETLAAAHPSSELPTHKIALSLLIGFCFMLVIERLVAPHAHSHGQHRYSHVPTQSAELPLHTVKPERSASNVQFDADAELGEAEIQQPSGFAQFDLEPVDQRRKAYPLTLGLVIHGLADGLALGVSALSTESSGALPDVSIVVFIALVIHKAPTALALATSLLATTLPRPECKKHIAFFSASTPVGALVSYTFFSMISASGPGDWTGVALLISGGTFLYVATVLQPVGNHEAPGEGLSEVTRTIYLIFGMMVPFVIGQILGHGHEHVAGSD